MQHKSSSKKRGGGDVHTKNPRLVLLDSHAIIHRAYHAIPDFTSAKGEPTGALYGLTAMLLKAAEELKPNYLIAARDLPGDTFRHKVFEEYKGTRLKTEDALVSQLETAHKVFDAFGIPIYDAKGFEADDILGTIVEELKDKDVDIVIASGDLDTLQLVSNKKVQVYTLRGGLSDTVLYDEDGVRGRFGFGPEFLPDYKGLRGDPSDNIKGIAGIGEKTASQIISEFGSLDNVYKQLKKTPGAFEKKGIKPRMVKLLQEGEDAAVFSKMLATIRRDAPITFKMPEKPWRLEDNAESISAMCDEFDFRSLKERMRAVLHKKTDTLPEMEKKKQELPDEKVLREASIALWLLHSDMTKPTLDDILRYAQTDDFEAARGKIFEELHKTGRLNEVYEKIERPLIPVVEKMNAHGIAVDTAYLKKLSKEYTGKLAQMSARIFGYVGHEFNINSPKQLGDVLYDELKLALPRMKKTAGGARTTREEELSKMSSQHPIIADVLSYRELQKLLSTYIDALPETMGGDGRLHATFLQAGTTTGRMASESPNLQNIPIRTESGQRIRHAFVAAKGCVLAALDYSQIELRIAAGLSGDEKLINVFKEGGDVHTAVAAEVFSVPKDMVDAEMRRRAKIINFGIIYGMGVNALRATLGEGVSRDEAANFLRRYFEDFPGLGHYIQSTKASAALQGYTETYFGRRRYFGGFKSSMPNVRAQAERMAINAPIQGTQADIIKLAMAQADTLIDERGWHGDVSLVLQVHDELVYEIKKDIAQEVASSIARVMESVVPNGGLGGVPIKTDLKIGENWGEMNKVARDSV